MDKDAFAQAVLARQNALWRIAWAILRREADCQDALQETALRAWAARGTLRHPAYFDTWLTRIHINVCRTMLKKRSRAFPAAAPQDDASPEPSPALDALFALPERLRLPAVLHYVEGYPLAQVAAMLRVPQSTVRGRLSRARATLRLELSRGEEDFHD